MAQLPQVILEFMSTIGLSTVLIFVLVLLLTLLLLSRGNPSVNWPPGPYCFPLVGSLPQMLVMSKKQQPTDLHPWYDTYGYIIHNKLGEQHFVSLGTYELIQEAFVKNAASISARPTWVYFLEQLVGKNGAGVIFKSGHEWKELRRFTLSSLRDFGLGRKSLEGRIQDEARYLVQCFEEENGKAFSPRDTLGKAVSNIISTVVFGTRYEYNDFPEMLRVLEQSLRLVEGWYVLSKLAKYLLPMKKILGLLDRVNELIRIEVERHQKSFDPNEIRDFIDLYLKVIKDGQDPEIYTEANVFRIIFDLYLAGSDTTTNTLRWSLVHMMNYPDVQRKVQQEIDEVLGQGRVAKNEDKVNMPYTEATILEVFRMSPIAPFGVPHATSEAVKLAGYTIPKGTLILADIYRVQHDENNFHDPYTFKPERWLDSEGKVVKSEKLINFSVGPRTCLGKGLAEMEAFIFFTTLLQNFTFKVPEGEAPPNGIEGANKGTFSPYPYNVVATRR